MRSNHPRRFFLQGLAGVAWALCRNAKAQDALRNTNPPFSQVPDEFQNALDDLPSPLIFKDGRRVQTVRDWQARREEIRKDWLEITGPWPAVVERPGIEVTESIDREGISQQKIRVQVASNQYSDGYLLLPHVDQASDASQLPAVFIPYYDPETSIGISKNKLRDFAWQLAKRGFVTLSIGSPGGDARKPVLDTSAKCQPLSYLGYIAANAWNALASMKTVDSKRIGIVGHSYGGKWAMFGSCLYDKYACAVWSDPGIVFDEIRESINYQEPWYLGLDPTTHRKPGLVREDSPRTGAYKTLRDRGHDLHELHALMAPRPFLVSGGEEDPPKRWKTLNHSIAVNKLLGMQGRVSMTNRMSHSPTEESNEEIYRFFEYWLKERF